jgi:hypothetical protein
MIPKIIHYCWFGGSVVPEKEQMCIASWHKFCKDYEIRKWDENNFDITKNQYAHDAYRNKKWAFVSDYARMDILYAHGGIYLDTDVEIIKPFGDLLTLEGFCGFEHDKKGNTFVNAGLGAGAGAGHPLIGEWRDDYDMRSFVKPNGRLNLTPCPVYQTDTLVRYGLKLENKKQTVMGMTVFPTEYFGPMNDITGEINITPLTYSIHHYSASWNDAADRERRELRRMYYKKYGAASNAISTLAAYVKHYGFLRTPFKILQKILLRYSESK